MIFLRSFGADQSVGVSNFVSIGQPAGVVDGDLILACVVLTDSSIDVTPPDNDWTLIARTDETRTGNVAVFWKFAQNEPSRWVFTLSSTVHPSGTYGIGGVLVYGGADGFEPVEAFSSATSPSALTQNVPAITASEAGEELVLFLGCDSGGQISAPSGFLAPVDRFVPGAASFLACRRQLDAAGTQAATTTAVTVAGRGAAVAIALRPSAGTMSVEDVRERIVAALPPGVDDVYDLTPTGDYYKYFQAIASWMKTYAFDLVDILRREIAPQFSRYKLPSWERIFGLETTRITKSGTVPQRQAQVTAAWRAAAGQGSSIPAVQGVLAPLLGYLPSTTVQVLECDRSALTLAHSYDVCGGADVTIPAGTTTLSVLVNDGGKVAAMGAMLNLAFASSDLSTYAFTLTGPDGTSHTWDDGWSAVPLVLRSPGQKTVPVRGSDGEVHLVHVATGFGGKQIQGVWQLAITNGSGVSNTLYSASTLFVEGIARGQDTAGAIFHWGVYADPAHLGENGVQPNFAEAQKAIRKLSFSHTVGNLILSISPWPGVSSGAHAAIPGRCTPNR